MNDDTTARRRALWALLSTGEQFTWSQLVRRLGTNNAALVQDLAALKDAGYVTWIRHAQGTMRVLVPLVERVGEHDVEVA